MTEPVAVIETDNEQLSSLDNFNRADTGGDKSGFTPPATQEEFNRIIGERVAREKAKYSDYADLQAKAAELDELKGKVTEADAVLATVPSQVAAALRTHLITLHGIETDDADLFLTATEPELLLRQVDRLVSRSGKPGNVVPREGSTNPTPPEDEKRKFTRELFGSVTP